MIIRRAFKWVLFWIGMALAFNLGIWLIFGPQKALEFLGGYIIEQSLSVDNLFVFLMIFSSFGVKPEYQRRALNYGIAGAVVMRLAFILLGSSLVQSVHWVLYVFGAILIISGVRMLFLHDKETDYSNSAVIKFIGRVIPFTGTMEAEKFFVRRNGRLHATLLFAILIVIELSDIIFAVDSIPAIFSITLDPLIVFTSNMFAILGLRSLYFVIEKLCNIFCYMKYGVAVILAFTGVKLCILIFHVEIPIALSIGIIAGILLVSILASLAANRRNGMVQRA